MGFFDFDWLFGDTKDHDSGTGTTQSTDSKGNKRRVTRKNGKVTNVEYRSADNVKHRNEQAMQDYLRRGSGR